MSTIKLAMLLSSGGDGGLEKHFVDLCNQLSEHPDFEVHAIAHPRYQERFNNAVTFHTADLTGSRKNPFTLFALAKLLRNLKPDIVHAQANKAAAMLGTIRHFVPGVRVATLHNLKKSVGMFDSYPMVIAVSRKAASVLNHNRCQVIYNGQNPSTTFQRYDRNTFLNEHNLPSDKPLFIAVGRMVYAKAFDALLEAWQHVDSNLVIVGDGPLKPDMEKKLDQLQLHTRVKLLGHRDDVLNLLASSDACVISSRNEGFPYVMVESLFVKTPMITTPVPGCEEVIPARAQTDYTAKAIAEKVSYWQNQLPQLRELFTDTFAFADSELTVSAMTNHHQNLYRRLLADACRKH